MRSKQSRFSSETGWEDLPSAPIPPDLVLVFGGRAVLEEGRALTELGASVPRDRIFGCSTAGEIEGSRLRDESVVATSVWFDRGHTAAASVSLAEAKSTEEAGRVLASRLPKEGLVHVLVFSDGLKVNGSDLVSGLRAALPPNVTLSGGLSGDGDAMKDTVVCHAGRVSGALITALGFYGPITVGLGSVGGWDAFGPIRRVTKAENGTLFELDGEPALALYKRYLGHHADALPASAFLFPLEVMRPGSTEPVVRTVISIDEAAGSMTFAGDMPVGARAQLMRANFERIINAGEAAAEHSLVTGHTPDLAVLISCVGRRRILRQRTEEELEAVRAVIGESVTATGFYSYGELAPAQRGAPCQLHNQTMTVTTFSES